MTDIMEIDCVRLHKRQATETGEDRPWLLDVRQAWELVAEPFPADRHVPMGEVAQVVHDLPRDRDIVVVCAHGMRSLVVTQWLRQNGFARAFSLAGGTAEWAKWGVSQGNPS